MFWVNLIIWAVVTVVTELVRPKPKFEDARPASLGDFNFPTATEGRVVPLIWGRVRLSGPNLVWYGDFRKQALKQEQSTGMFTSDDVTVGFRYYVGMQFALCHGPVDRLRGIWINKKYRSKNIPHGAEAGIAEANILGGENNGQGGIYGGGTFYAGTEDQVIEPYLSTFQDPQPAYRGICYYTWEVDSADEFEINTNYTEESGRPYKGWIGNSASIPQFEFELERIPDGLDFAGGADAGAESPNGFDANPMNVLYEILTNTDWGLSIPPSDIDSTNFREAGVTLADEGNGFSMVVDRALEITEIIDEIQRQIDGSLFFNRGTGQWQVKLARDDYTPGDLDVFDESNIVKLVDFTRQTWEETTNQVRVSFIDRDDDYKQTYALAQDTANMDIQGQTVSADVNYPGVKNAALANSLAWRDLRVLAFPMAKIKIEVNREAFNLVPGSVFKFSWKRLGITEMIVRVSSINYGKAGSSAIEITAFQDIFATGAGIFSDPANSDWEEPTGEAVPTDEDESLLLEAPRQIVLQDPWNPNYRARGLMATRFPGGSTVSIQAYEKIGTSRPISGDYKQGVPFSSFVRAGQLDAALPAYTAGTFGDLPVTGYTITVDEVDSLAALVGIGDETLVQSLLNVAYIDGEYLGFETVTDLGGGQVRLEGIWRGLFHTAPKDHDAGARIWFIGRASTLNRTLLPAGYDELDVQLRSVGAGGDEVAEVDTPTLALSIQDVYWAPLAPRYPVIDGVNAGTTFTLDNDITVGVTPRDWHVADPTQDETLTAEFADDSPEYDLYLQLDDGASGWLDVGPVVIDATAATPEGTITPEQVVLALDTEPVRTTARIKIVARHTVDGTEYTNPVPLLHEGTLDSWLPTATVVHGIITAAGSAEVTYNAGTGSYGYKVPAALPAGVTLEGRLNGGAWTTIISAGNTSGGLAVTDGDDVELRFTGSPTDDLLVEVETPGAVGEYGYGVIRS